MTNSKHHTRRLAIARKKALKKWKKGLINATKDVGSEPVHEEHAFCVGFNMGYKTGRIHGKTLPPLQKQRT